MPMVLLFDGLFNTAFFGFALWFWVGFILLLGGAIANFLFWWFFWLPLEPLHGHYFAYRKGNHSALTSDLNNNMRLTTEGWAKVISYISVEEAKELQKDWDEYEPWHIGVVHTDLIFDAFHWTHPKSRSRPVIEELTEHYNEEHESDQILTYGKFLRYVRQGKLTPPADFKTEVLIPWARIKAQYPATLDGRNPAIKDGYVWKLAEKMMSDEKKQLSQNMPIMILLFGGFIIGLMWVARFMHVIGPAVGH